MGSLLIFSFGTASFLSQVETSWTHEKGLLVDTETRIEVESSKAGGDNLNSFENGFVPEDLQYHGNPQPSFLVVITYNP